MTARAQIRQADVARVVRGALKAGLPVGSFSVEVVDGIVRLLPIAANAPSDDAADMERRMREAFGE
jgi:hypothetical protein